MSLGWTRALTALALGTLTALPAFAQTKSKSIRTEGEWVRYDADAKIAVVKVTKPGEGVEAARLRRGKEAEFAVKPEGSVLTRTTVAINDRKAELTDIAEGKTVNIYWRPDEKDPTIPRARKIDVVLSDTSSPTNSAIANWAESIPARRLAAGRDRITPAGAYVHGGIQLFTKSAFRKVDMNPTSQNVRFRG